MSLKGMIQVHNKGKETQGFTPSPQGTEAGFSCEPQTSLMRLVINKDLVREGGADH